jgi:hypothetical protein
MISGRRDDSGGIGGGGGGSHLSRSLLSMYVEQPNEEVTLEDFEIAAFDRLKGTFFFNVSNFYFVLHLFSHILTILLLLLLYSYYSSTWY